MTVPLGLRLLRHQRENVLGRRRASSRNLVFAGLLRDAGKLDRALNWGAVHNPKITKVIGSSIPNVIETPNNRCYKYRGYGSQTNH